MRLNSFILPLACLHQAITGLQLDINNSGKANKIRGLARLTVCRFYQIRLLENRPKCPHLLQRRQAGRHTGNTAEALLLVAGWRALGRVDRVLVVLQRLEVQRSGHAGDTVPGRRQQGVHARECHQGRGKR
jgi:hypothetical protein